jgi:hypothetical protein
LSARVPFRHIPKTGFGLKIPPRVLKAIKERAHAEERSYTLVVTEALCRHVGLDPTEFGIEPATAEPSAV